MAQWSANSSGSRHEPMILQSAHWCCRDFSLGSLGSVSREKFEALLKKHEDPKRIELPAMFSWLSTQIPGYVEPQDVCSYSRNGLASAF
jgi:hypothetical protein